VIAQEFSEMCIPDRWVVASFETVLQRIGHQRKVKQRDYLASGAIPVIDQGEVFIGGYTNDGAAVVACAPPFVVFGDHTRQVKFVNFCFAPGADGVIILKPCSGIEPKLACFLIQVLIHFIPDRGYARHFQFLRKSVVPVPPLVEQRAIVAKIEELFSELDKGIEQLQTVKQQLNQYRQAVLKAAFEGKLTAEWRAEQQAAGNLPDADELLEQIKKERQERYQQQLQEWKQAVVEWEEAGGRESGRKKPRKPAAPELISLLTEEGMADLAELPQSWVWCRPSDICAPDDYSLGIGPFGSNLKVSDYTDSGVPLIFVRNITGRSFAEFQHFVSYSKAEMLVPHSVYPLDLLITKMGDPPGDVAIYPEGCPPAILTADCVKFRVWNEFVLRDFVALSVESQLVRRQLGLITKGVAQKKISLGRFKSVCFPLPCKSEQQQIVAQLSSRFSVLDELDKAVDHGLEQAEALRQSILKKAFEGRLLTEAELAAVRNDPEYESADKLLERIRAQAGKTTR
jgi:type I restriction enzyme S subunit